MTAKLTVLSVVCALASMSMMAGEGVVVAVPDGTASEGNAVDRIEIVETASGEWSPGLDESEKETLFRLAEDTLRWCTERPMEKMPLDGYRRSKRLGTEMATFVTLKAEGALRGCIGSLVPVESLFDSVHRNTINAAMNDHRFRPVGADEVDGLDLSISILSLPVAIESPDEFKLGEHGIIIEKAGRRAVYLPEVPVEQGWDMEQTLGSLCMKAGMGPEEWRSGCSFQVFSTVVLSRRDVDEGDKE